MKSIPREHRPRLEAVVRAGKPLPIISPHDLRHTAGILMLRQGVPLEVVSKTLGHSDISLTLLVFRHVLDSERRAHVIDLFPSLLERHSTAVPVN